jgi:hypothetical protein
VHDTDGLTAFLYKIKRDFSIKIHHKTEYAKENHLEAGIELNPHHHTIKFNDNTYIEFKPKHHHEVILPLEARRRPFFQ